MSWTAEIITGVQAVAGAAADAQTTGGQALERAGELAEEAAAHCWDGVDAAMQSVRESLETTLASLSTAGDTIGEMTTVLGEISAQSSRPEVAGRLGQALDHVERIRTALEAASGGVDEAKTASEQAGSPESLMSMLQTAADETDTAWRGLDGVKASIEAEQQEAGGWGN
jgi:hypothetical protein